MYMCSSPTIFTVAMQTVVGKEDSRTYQINSMVSSLISLTD